MIHSHDWQSTDRCSHGSVHHVRVSDALVNSAQQNQKAVTAYLKSKQLLPIGFARQNCILNTSGDMQDGAGFHLDHGKFDVCYPFILFLKALPLSAIKIRCNVRPAS